MKIFFIFPILLLFFNLSGCGSRDAITVDGEAMTGYAEGEIPWQKGFFLESSKSAGFFLTPVDSHSNNIKVFIVAKSVRDVTVMG